MGFLLGMKFHCTLEIEAAEPGVVLDLVNLPREGEQHGLLLKCDTFRLDVSRGNRNERRALSSRLPFAVFWSRPTDLSSLSL